MVVFQEGKVTRLSAFCAFNCKSPFNRSFSRKVRCTEAFKLNCAGPVMESLPALPHCPAAGVLYAAGVTVPDREFLNAHVAGSMKLARWIADRRSR